MKNKCLRLALITTCLGMLSSCGSDPNFSASPSDSTTSSGTTEGATAAGSNSVRIRLDSDSFVQIDDPDLSVATGLVCPGDAKKYYEPFKLDGSGNLSEIVDSTGNYKSDGVYGTRPSFIHNISVDLTNANYYATAMANSITNTTFDTMKTALKVSFDNCSYRYHSKIKPSFCAAFDSPLVTPLDGAALSSIVSIPYSSPNAFLTPFVGSSGGGDYSFIDGAFRYVNPNTATSKNSFYKLLDVKTQSFGGVDYYTCADQGLIQSGFPEESRLYVGGVDIDIDRSYLTARENLLMHLTYIPMGNENDADAPNYTNDIASRAIAYDSHSEAVFKVHLMSLGDASPSVTRGVAQPRHLTYSNEINYPKTVASLAVLTRPYGQAREEQLVIPLSMSSDINRIRIERVQGSAVLIEVSLYRLGAKL